MELDAFLAAADAQRATRTLYKLAEHDIGQWALAGGLALEIHVARAGGRGAARQLNDLDFIVDSFEAIPRTLGRDFLFRHVHPDDPAGKALLQAVDPETRLRVDVFRAYDGQMERQWRFNWMEWHCGWSHCRMLRHGWGGSTGIEQWTNSGGQVCARFFAGDGCGAHRTGGTGLARASEARHAGNFADASSQVRALIAARPELIDRTGILNRCEWDLRKMQNYGRLCPGQCATGSRPAGLLLKANDRRLN